MLKFWLKWSLNSPVILFCDELVFLIATYKPKSCWKALKFKLFFDESFPAASPESQVLFTWQYYFIHNSCLHFAHVCCVANCISRLISFFYVPIQRQRRSKINWKWFPVFGMHQMLYESPQLNVMHSSKYRTCSLWTTADGYKCTALVHHQRIYL